MIRQMNEPAVIPSLNIYVCLNSSFNKRAWSFKQWIVIQRMKFIPPTPEILQVICGRTRIHHEFVKAILKGTFQEHIYVDVSIAITE